MKHPSSATWAYAVLLITQLVISCEAQQRKTLLTDQASELESLKTNASSIKAVTVDVKLQASANSSKVQDRPQYFAICVSAKDQHEDIAEWVQYHEQLGAGKVYVYDDNSNPPMLTQLTPFIESGLVEYHFIGKSNHSSIPKPQLYVYDQCIERYRTKHKFIAFIDVDEFLFLRDPNISSMPQLLRDYEDYGALAVNWIQFGSSGHVHRPQGGTLGNFWKCIPRHHPQNLHVKTIANTKYVLRVKGNPHMFMYAEGKEAVGENFEVVEGATSKSNEISRVALYHYVTKSKAQYVNKMERGSAMKNHKTIEFFDYVEAEATADCKDAMHLVHFRAQQT